MYKLMLVEDEEIVRESMIQKIVWEQYGFQLSGACRNGQEALEQEALLWFLQSPGVPYVISL